MCVSLSVDLVSRHYQLKWIILCEPSISHTSFPSVIFIYSRPRKRHNEFHSVRMKLMAINLRMEFHGIK
jgi:hypothetical protein